jgi:hypothetical protein
MREHGRYLILVLISLPCFILLALLFVRSDFLFRHDTVVEDILLERRYDFSGIDADVVFVGDSSLMFGVIPNLVQAQTGLSAYSLGTAAYVLIAAPNLLLDDYLRTNRAPRLVILYLAPWARVNPPYAFNVAWNVGVRMLVGRGSPAQIARYFIDHSEVVIPSLADFWSRLLSTWDWRSSTYNTVVADLIRERGWFPSDAPILRLPEGGLKDGCSGPTFSINPDTTYLASFRGRLAARGIDVAVYVAPMPDCDPSDTRAQRAYAGIADNSPYVLPHKYFVDDSWYAHLSPDGAAENTMRVSAFLQRYLTDKATVTDHLPVRRDAGK